MTLVRVVACSFFALAFSGAVIWIMEVKALTAHRSITPISYTFLAGSITFSFIYILNRLVFPFWPKMTVALNLTVLAAIFLLPVLRKNLRHKRPRAGKKHRLHSEASGLQQMLEKDPLNAFCHERLSDIYGELGKYDRALEAALEAFRLDPTIKNKWRVEDFKQYIQEKKMRRKRWNPF